MGQGANTEPRDEPADRAFGDRAAAVLRANDVGGWTKASPQLYPHQWSWDSAFIAIGWAYLDPGRALRELASLFAAQWRTGMVPHIVFSPVVPHDSYFPDASRWDCARLAAAAPPAPPHTSGLCQPPVHAIAAWRIWEITQARFPERRDATRVSLTELYPKLFAWHRYLMTRRDPETSGLVTIYHPWESGTDNSPRWDRPLAAVTVGDLPPYTRSDLRNVADASQRPTQAEYDRYLWLVECLKTASYDDATVQQSHPFLVKDVLLSAILVEANQALIRLGELVGAAAGERQEIETWIERGRSGLDRQWDATLGLCLDHDVRAQASIPVRTIAGLAPLIAGGLTPERQAALLATLASPMFTADPRLRWPVPPSTSPTDPAFQPRRYWRGPTWPVMTWLFSWALRRTGVNDPADRLRAASLAQLRAIGFPEYVEPFTGEPLGSSAQSWTAAVALDWLYANAVE